METLLRQLDQAIENEDLYNEQKENRIENIKSALHNRNLTRENRYIIYQGLTKEYETYICDSARLYANKCADIARQLKNNAWIEESKLMIAGINAKAGMFNASIDLLNSIRKEYLSAEQQTTYYKTYFDTYIYWLEYQDGNDIKSLVSNKLAYQDSLLGSLTPETYEFAINYGTKQVELGEFEKAREHLFGYLERVKPDTRDYSIITSLIAYYYERTGNRELQKEYLALSAISDIRACIKENVSLRTLSILMFEDQDINRANNHIKKSMKDANFYNARLRNIQIARFLPVIDGVFQIEREKHQDNLRKLLITISILSFFLILTIFMLSDRMRKLSRAQREILQINSDLNKLYDNLKTANQRQIQINNSLAEANVIKEQFIGSFLEICTEYIERLSNFKSLVNRKVKVGQTADLIKLTGSPEENKELYDNFDKTFLTIYPNFVGEFNKLLRQEEQYELENENTLNQELRIFALIRLGITDSNKIATFLNYSLRTIYNYRSKVKSKAINTKQDFEERVKKLCSYTDNP
ncbi:MAG: DUF6377 domain-containing protein [Bacteroides sp.]|nr:DUF6377 domain-containing protein [Bacteroides sp.]